MLFIRHIAFIGCLWAAFYSFAALAQVVIPQQREGEKPNAAAGSVTSPAKTPAPIKLLPNTKTISPPSAGNMTPAPFMPQAPAVAPTPPAWEALLNPKKSRPGAEQFRVSKEEISQLQQRRKEIYKKFNIPEPYSPFGDLSDTTPKNFNYQISPKISSGQPAKLAGSMRFIVSAAPKFGSNDQNFIKTMVGWQGQNIFQQCRMEHFILFKAGGYVWPLQMDKDNVQGNASFEGKPEGADVMVLLSCNPDAKFPDYQTVGSRVVNGFEIPVLPPMDMRAPLVNGRRLMFLALTPCPLGTNPRIQANKITLRYAYTGDRTAICEYQ